LIASLFTLRGIPLHLFENMKLSCLLGSITLLAFACRCESYQYIVSKKVSSSTSIFSKAFPDSERNQLFSEGSNILRGISKLMTVGLFAKILISTAPASAKTFFDTDVYGDKELKIGTVFL